MSIEEIPEGLSQVPSKRRLIVHPEGKGSEAVSITTDEQGSFCSYLKPGKHVIKVEKTYLDRVCLGGGGVVCVYVCVCYCVCVIV